MCSHFLPCDLAVPLYRSCVFRCAINFCFGRETDLDQVRVTSRSTCHVPAEAVNVRAWCVWAFCARRPLSQNGSHTRHSGARVPPGPGRATDNTQTRERGAHLAVVSHRDLYLTVAVLVATAKPDSGRQKDLEVISPGLGVSGPNLRRLA